MKTSPFKVFVLSVCAFLTAQQINFSQQIGKDQLKRINKTILGQPNTTRININNISTVIHNDGVSDNNNNQSAFYFPNGSNKILSYSSGVLFGGYAGVLRFGGTHYWSSLQPGKMLDALECEDPNLPHVRIYRVRPDYLTSSFENEISDGEGTYEQIKEQYIKDVNEWPSVYGAPYDDTNSNGIYEPGIDIPGIPGAHQTIWFVANDAQHLTGNYQYNTNFELQVTIWSYNVSGPLQNVIFKKYKVINKHSYDVRDIYLGIFADVDIGNSNDDYAGCDSLLGLGYAYNADDLDGMYDGTSPAIGFDFLQGPVIESNPEDIAIYDGQKINGYKNLGMTSYVYFTCGGIFLDYPVTDLDWYKYMSGLNPETGQRFSVPTEFGGGLTSFINSGDPVNGTGWIDGNEEDCGERYILLATGPFNIAKNDTQEIVFAQMAALGENRLQSVAELKELDYQIQRLYDEYLYTFPKNIYAINELTKVNAQLSEDRYESTVIVDWDENQQIEDRNFNGYSFQGYNVYQFRSDMALRENGVRLATYDIIDGVKTITEEYYDPFTDYKIEIEEQFGTDSGIQRTFTFEKDYINDEPFIKGKTYYFGVSSYYYYPDWLSQSPLGSFRKTLESDIQLLQVTIREDESGFAYGDTIFAGRVTGLGEGSIYAVVKNPGQLTGHSYKIEFDSLGSNLIWNLIDLYSGDKILENQKIIPENNNYDNINFPMIDGMEIRAIQSNPKVAGKGNGIVEVEYGGENIPPEGWDERGALFQGNCVWLDPNWEGNDGRDRFYISTSRYHVENSDIISHITNYHDYELRFTDGQNFAVFYYHADNEAVCIEVPFELWDIGMGTINDQNDDVRLIPIFDGPYSLYNSWWATSADQILNYPCTPSFRWEGPEDRSTPTISYDNFANVCIASGGNNSIYNFALDNSVNKFFTDNSSWSHVNNFKICDFDNDGLPPPAGSTIRINTIKPLSPSDTFIFSTYTDVKEEKLPNSFVLHQNYPNPFNPSTVISYQLSEGGFVKLKVYDILGREIATLVDEYKQAGIYNSIFNSLHSALSSGVYFYTLNVINSSLHPVYQETRKMILLK